jgi:hypothetical protein
MAGGWNVVGTMLGNLLSMSSGQSLTKEEDSAMASAVRYLSTFVNLSSLSSDADGGIYSNGIGSFLGMLRDRGRCRDRDRGIDRRGGASSSFNRLSSDNTDGAIYSNGNGIGSFLGMICDRDRDRDLGIDRPRGASSSSNRRSCLEPYPGLGLTRGFDRPIEGIDSGLSVALERIVLECVEAGLSSSFERIIFAWADVDCVELGSTLASALVLASIEAGFSSTFRIAILACAERECVAAGV